jgi:hypothetical protein
MGFFDNERYLISALVQSLAATIALVVSLSLVAVQLAAQSYSARVIDVYKNNPDMWILLSIYIAVIFYGLGLLKVIDIGVAGINMEFAIFAAYFLGFFAFVCLVPYMLKTLDLLKPSVVIKLLAADITKEKILETLKKDGEIADKDPVQPIIDMINAALERNDYETVRNGLKAIKNLFDDVDQSEDFDYSAEVAILKQLGRKMQRKLPGDPQRMLEKKLQMAVEGEKFEEAALLRDQLSKIKKHKHKNHKKKHPDPPDMQEGGESPEF